MSVFSYKKKVKPRKRHPSPLFGGLLVKFTLIMRTDGALADRGPEEDHEQAVCSLAMDCASPNVAVNQAVLSDRSLLYYVEQHVKNAPPPMCFVRKSRNEDFKTSMNSDKPIRQDTKSDCSVKTTGMQALKSIGPIHLKGSYSKYYAAHRRYVAEELRASKMDSNSNFSTEHWDEMWFATLSESENVTWQN